MTSTRLRVRVTPRSGRDEVIGWLDCELRVRVRAAPVQGQANDAICRLVAKLAGVSASAVQAVNGATSRTKTLLVEGMDEETLRKRLTP